jgi:hypothetical protein
MKAPELNSQTKNFFLGILTATMIFSFVSCSPKVVFLTSSVVPAANGYVKIKRDHNNNYVIQVKISTLAGVERLQPAKQTYVIWMVTNDGTNKNIGRVQSSNKLKVSFETVSSSKPIQIFLTAEENESVQYPGEQIVLSTGKFWDKQ